MFFEIFCERTQWVIPYPLPSSKAIIFQFLEWSQAINGTYDNPWKTPIKRMLCPTAVKLKKQTIKQRKREPISAPGLYVLNFEKLDREAIPQETFEQLIPILNIFLAITNIWCREEPVSLPET